MTNFKKLAKNIFRTKRKELLLFSVLFLVFFSPVKAEAALDNNRVIDDGVFSSAGTMNEAQIQAFLASRGSYLATYTVPAERYETYGGVSYFEGTWVGPIGSEVNATGWSAAHLIYMDAQWYGINPQVLLATLQKESSLVTNGAPPFYLPMWAMGYAYTESGIKPYCGPPTTNTNHNPSGSCAGFAMQMDWAAGGLKYWQNLANVQNKSTQYWTGNTINIDGINVYLGNGATAALYRYTPHMQTSFYNIYTGWFGSLLWNGPYIIANASAPEPRSYYLVDGNTKRYLSYDVYMNWGLNRYPVVFVSEQEFNSYTESTALTNHASDGATIYIIDKGEKKWVPDPNTFNVWGFDWSKISQLSSATLNYIPSGSNFSYIVKAPDPASEIYLVDNGIRHHILDPGMLGHLGSPTRNTGIISVDLLSTLAVGSDLDKFIIKGSGIDKFVLDRGFKRYVPSMDTLSAWGLASSGVITINDVTLSSLLPGNNLSYLAQRPGDQGIYFVESGTRKPIANLDTFNNWGFSQNDVFMLSYLPVFYALPTTTALTRFPRSSADGKIYLVENGKKLWIQSAVVFNLYGFNWGDVSDASSGTLTLLSNGPDITLPPGCTNSCVRVYRFYNYRLGAHFYTTQEEEKTKVMSYTDTYRYEGVSNFGESLQVAGTVPVHRFYNFNKGAYFYTSNQAEATYVNNNLYSIYRYEGVAYYVYPTQQPNIVPVHRFYNFNKGTYFYTSNQAEATYLNFNATWTYRYEGVVFYAISVP